MGCIMSSAHKPPSKWSKTNKSKSNIRVVHFDGRIEDYSEPIKVNQIIHNPKKDVLCTKSQLLCPTSSSKALNSDCELELGNLYFLMPISAFKNEASAMDMTNMVNKLTNIAKSTRLKAECPRPVAAAVGGYGSGPGRVEGVKGCAWKPVLSAIGESESDSQEY